MRGLSLWRLVRLSLTACIFSIAFSGFLNPLTAADPDPSDDVGTAWAWSIATQPAAPPAAPPAPPTVCEGNRCTVRGSQPIGGFAVVPRPTFTALPSGYQWQATAQGHGIAGPSGGWYLPPSSEHSSRLSAGYFYTPMPEANNFPRGVWVSPCIKDGDCRVIECNIPAIGQHGEPTAANARDLATARGNAFHPGNYSGGYQQVLTPCEGGNCPAQSSESVAWPNFITNNGPGVTYSTPTTVTAYAEPVTYNMNNMRGGGGWKPFQNLREWNQNRPKLFDGTGRRSCN